MPHCALAYYIVVLYGVQCATANFSGILSDVQKTPIVTLKSPNALPILCYHKVGSERELGRRLNIEPNSLEAHARFFKRRGFSSVTGKDICVSWRQRSVWFTFDDGFSGAVTLGSEILEKYGFRGTFFIVGSRVGLDSDWEGELPFLLANWDELRDVSGRGHEVANHTFTHRNLSHLSVEDQKSEISETQRLLSDFESPSFCYPYGGIGSETVEIVRSVGLKVGVTLEKRIAVPADQGLLMPRIQFGYGGSIPLLVYKLLVRPRLSQFGL